MKQVKLKGDAHQFLKDKVVRNNDLYKILGDNIKCGPLDGGCWVTAKALQRHLKKGELYVVASQSGRAEHVVLKTGSNEYIDADGISTTKQLLNRWETVEGLKNPSIRKYRGTDLSDSPRSRKVVNVVVDYLSGTPNERYNISKGRGTWAKRVGYSKRMNSRVGRIK